jgi:UDP-glucose:(heptosyl)LPS alpha-1,3-glucosyltransferase
MAVGLGVADRVAFAGPVDNGLERYYLGSDVLLLLSKFDTFGMVVLEAMAAGLPVIISPSVGARDVVRQGWNGYVVDPGQIQRVSHHIVLALDPRNHSTMAANARTTAERHCWDNLARDILRLYCELLQCDAAKDPLKE